MTEKMTNTSYSYSDTFEKSLLVTADTATLSIQENVFPDDRSLLAGDPTSLSQSSQSEYVTQPDMTGSASVPDYYSSSSYSADDVSRPDTSSIVSIPDRHPSNNNSSRSSEEVPKSYTSNRSVGSSSISDTRTYMSSDLDASSKYLSEGTDLDEGSYVYSDTFDLPSSRPTKSYLESVASSENTSGKERKYFQESFDSASGTAIDFDAFGIGTITESLLFGPTTEEIRELTEEDVQKAEAFEAQENFINLWINKLKHSRLVNVKDAPQPEFDLKERLPEEKQYCHQMIRRIRKNQHKERNTEGEKTAEKKQTPLEAFGLNSAVVEKIKLQNFIRKMEQMANEEIHDVNKCKDCRRKQRVLDLAEDRKHFLTASVNQLRSKDLDRQVEDHCIRTTSINLIGEFLRGLPRGVQSSAEVLYLYKQQILKRKESSLS